MVVWPGTSLTLVTIACCVLAKYDAAASEDVIPDVLFLLGIALIIFLYGAFFVVFLFREYAIDQEGITVRYLKRFHIFYPWEDIRLICLCEVHQGKLNTIKSDVIWCSMGEKRKNPPVMPRFYHEIEYEFFHQRTILTMEYSPARLEAFRLCSGSEIPDYRQQMHQRIFSE